MRPIDLAIYAFFTFAAVVALWSIGGSIRQVMEFLDDLPPKP
jgi:hypothetical protein